MATNNRSDIAIETAEAIDALLAHCSDWPEEPSLAPVTLSQRSSPP
jgi:hypothetical protein